MKKGNDFVLPSGVNHVHFIGIGGYGMSALAMILLQMGYVVSGSDLKPSRLTDRLKSKGAAIYFDHKSQNIDGCDMVVYSTAIPEGNPEITETRRLNIPLWHRSELLAEMVNNHHGIAVAGTHGKTTTTSMLSLLLEKGGLDPTAVIGGEVSVFNGNARLGKSNYLVAEACESDNSFLRYHPKLAIITNIEADHLENYDGDFNKLKLAYEEFISNVDKDGCIVICGEDPILQGKSVDLPGKVVTFGVNDNGSAKQQYDFSAKNVSYTQLGSKFSIYHKGEFLTEAKLRVPGRHNICNAIGAIAAAAELGVDLKESIKALYDFTGAGRRFEILGEVGEVIVVDDYAHHPTEIKATLQAARNCGKQRTIAIFQPHRYSRTSFFMKDYAEAFSDADIVLLHSVYAAGESPIDGVSSELLAEMIIKKSGKIVFYEDALEDLAAIAVKESAPGDMIITMGAGDISKAGHMILEMLPEERKSAASS